MRFTILKCGTIRTWRHLLAGDTVKPERIDVPVPFYVIEHNEHLLLFDCGQQKPVGPINDGADYITLMNEDDTLSNQLQQCGIATENITGVILSHTHSDHVGGLSELGAVECIIQQKETETAAGKKLLAGFPEKKWRIIDGETDFSGDGRIILLPTPGHTAGHQSMLLTLDDGMKLCLTADALYMDCALDSDQEMRFTSREAVECFRAMRDEKIHIISGHDPVSFELNQKRFNHF